MLALFFLRIQFFHLKHRSRELFGNLGLPFLITTAMVLLAIWLAWFGVDPGRTARLPLLPVEFEQGGDISTILSAIAGIMASVVAILYSSMFVMQTLASSQFSPRLLRSFAREPLLQVCAGICLGMLGYSLTLLGLKDAISAVAYHSYVILLTIFLGVCAMFMLLYTIIRASQMIQINNIVARIGHETHKAIADRMPLAVDAPLPPPIAELPGNYTLQTQVFARKTGYFDLLDVADLRAMAERYEFAVEVLIEIGKFVTPLLPVLVIHHSQPLPQGIERMLLRTLFIEPAPSIDQDPEYGIRLLGDIALRAISPAINDPSTAVTCLDYLEAMLVFAATRQSENTYFMADKRWCVHYPPVNFRKLLTRATRQLRHYGRGDYATTARLLRLLDEVASATRLLHRLHALEAEVRAVFRHLDASAFGEHDMQEIERRYHKALETICLAQANADAREGISAFG